MMWYNCIIFFITFHCCYADLYEGDDCKLKNDQKGKCVRLSLCPSAIKIVQNKQHPVTCSYMKFIPIVCCPVGEELTTRLSEHKCSIFQKVELKPIEEISSTNRFEVINSNTNEPFTSPTIISQKNSNKDNNTNETEEIYEFSLDIRSPNRNDTNSTINYFQQVFANILESVDSDKRGIINTNISGINVFPTNNSNNLTHDVNDINDILHVIGGTNVSEGEFPHMAALGFSKDEKILWLCGGSLISEKFVLTAAHCLSSPDFGKIKWVSLGTSFINLISDNSFINPSQQVIKIIRRISYPLYKRPATYHDIALVELARTVDFTMKIKPACLPVNNDLNFEEQLIATGWGLTEFGGNASEILMKVSLDVFSGEECSKIYGDMAGTRRLIKGIDEEVQICAGRKQGREDTCSGDSGGPLQLKINSNNGPTYVLIGITSFGKACGIFGSPGVYTRISKYVPWIESIIWPDEF